MSKNTLKNKKVKTQKNKTKKSINKTISIFLFTRDLRLTDNYSLYQSLSRNKHIIPVFIFTPSQISETKNKYFSKNSFTFMVECLDELKKSLKKYNNTLFTYYGETSQIIKNIIDTCIDETYEKIELHYSLEYTPYGITRENELKTVLEIYGDNVEIIGHHNHNLLNPCEVLQSNNNPYTVFTPYYRKHISLHKNIRRLYSLEHLSLKINNELKVKLDKLSSRVLLETIIKKTKITLFEHSRIKGGEKEGMKIIKSLKQFKNYDNERNNLTKSTTRLSAYLKYGCLSIIQVYNVLKQHFGIHHGLIKQLIWRDFYSQLVYHFSRVLKGKSLKEKYDKIKWEKNSKWLKKWTEGKTGFPIVDAGMRELNETGYMHNRARLITSNFLVKLLFIDWRYGEKYFASQLIDYDPASNNGNWQWTSGSGADSQPYFRIMNPWSQSERHDINAEYIKKWVPELKDVLPEHIHSWDENHNQYDIDYPSPMIDYKERRKYVLSKYKEYL